MVNSCKIHRGHFRQRIKEAVGCRSTRRIRMDTRLEFVMLAAAVRSQCSGTVPAALGDEARRPVTSGWSAGGYTGEAGLSEQSRRPQNSPARSVAAIEQCRAVDASRASGLGRAQDRQAVLKDSGAASLFQSHQTVTAILKRHGDRTGCTRWRFVRPRPLRADPQPNELWQMDFKGHFGAAYRAVSCADRARRSFALFAGAGRLCQ